MSVLRLNIRLISFTLIFLFAYFFLTHTHFWLLDLSASEKQEERVKERRRKLWQRWLQEEDQLSLVEEDRDWEREFQMREEEDFAFYEGDFHEYQKWEAEQDVLVSEGERGFGVDYGAVRLRIFGRTNMRATYGDSFYVSQEDRLNDTLLATSNTIRRGFDLNMDMKVNIKGKIGRRVTVDIDFDKNERQTENTFKVQYKALRRREFVQEVTFGNIELSFPKSEFAVFEQRGKQTVGLESRMERGKLKFHTIATLTQGEHAIDRFTGGFRNSTVLLPEYRFTPRKYYQLEPFLHYGDGCSPVINASSWDKNSPQALATLTSRKANAATFVPLPVDIDPGSLRIYLDDRDPRNDTALSAVPWEKISLRCQLTTCNSLGTYHLLQEGKDYGFNPRMGRIVFFRGISDNFRLFVQYTRASGGPTCDPTAWQDGGTGVIETFLRWESTLQEDVDYNGSQDVIIIDDQKFNLDIYEVRGIYELGVPIIQEAAFQLGVVNRGFQNVGQLAQLGSYQIDFLQGIISFNLREPFKQLRDSSGNFYLTPLAESTIYTDRQPSFVAENSLVYLRADFRHEVRNYRLSHTNIMRNTVVVRINGALVDPSKYYVDYNSGYFSFINPNDPVIGPDTVIEISYEYSPFGTSTQGYIAGLRTDYEANRSVKLGSTILYNGQFEPTVAPLPGQEPISRLVAEFDLNLNFDEERITRLFNTVPGVDFDLLPVKINAYGEYARSFYNPNTFGMALIDDMESSEDVFDIEISDKDWILASPPLVPGTNVFFHPCSRAPLYYRYYRDPADVRRGLLDLGVSPFASPPYSQLSGPYNVAEGHLDPSQLNVAQAERQVSLVLEFDFSLAPLSSNRYVAVMTRNFSPIGADFSNITYLEFNARLIDAVALSGVEWFLDLGTVSEDSDSDGRLDSEDFGLDGVDGDTNGNGIRDSFEYWDAGERNFVLDAERDGLRSEDRGYVFDPPNCDSARTIVGAGPDIAGFPVTKGNGVLDTEDLDRNGLLSQDQAILTIPVSSNNAYVFEQGHSNTLLPGDWKLFRIQIDKGRLTPEEKKALRQVRTIRLYLRPLPGSENGKGRMLISGMRFGGSRWRFIEALRYDNVSETVTDPQVFSVANIDNFFSKNEYRTESFLLSQRSTWEALHGRRTNTEYARMREAALRLAYDFSSTNYQEITVRRNFSNTMDLRFYDKITVWVNYRDEPPQTSFLFRIGSSERDYLEFSSPIKNSGWQKLQFLLRQSQKQSGQVNLKEINVLSVGVRTENPQAKGVIWVNEIYVEEPRVQIDDAYKTEFTMEITKPIFVTASGVPILSDIKLNYKERFRGRRFASVGQTETNMDERRQEFQVGTALFPFWRSRYSLLQILSDADPEVVTANVNQQGRTHSQDHAIEQFFRFANPHVPQLTLSHQYRRFDHERSQVVAETNPLLAQNPRRQKFVVKERTHTPALILQENFPEIFKTKIRYELKSSVRFFSRSEQSHIPAMPLFLLPEVYTDRQEKEQMEDATSSLALEWGPISLNPSYAHRSTKLVFKNYTDNNNLTPVEGDFYLPWFSQPRDFRYRQRQTNYELQFLWQNLAIFSPQFTLTASYQETSFRDNILTYQMPRYQRLKQPLTQTMAKITLPISFEKVFPRFSILRALTPSFTREILFNENSLPFTAKTGIYEDPYGLRRTLPPLAEHTYFIWQYPMWHHFTSTKNVGRNNFSRARDFVRQMTLVPQAEPGYDMAFQNYDNSITLRENFNTSAQWDVFSPLTLRTDVRLAQNTVRNNLKALPSQSANWGYSVLQTWDLMQLLDFWFWAKKEGHSSSLDLNLAYDRTMRITENLREDRINPTFGLNFGWYERGGTFSSLAFQVGITIRDYNEEHYIRSTDPPEDVLILKSIPPRPSTGIREREYGYDYAVEYRTEMVGLKNLLQELTGLMLRYNPRYQIRFSLNLNRLYYDIYQLLTKPTLDQYTLYQKIDMNLHPNVSGDFDLRLVWDSYRDPVTRKIRQEIFSFQVGLGARILF
ncbi:MAG: hypothetical protein NZM25_08810 [Leptospiraceae bacterium]|nr:hypothetical protein [Leptospiraceae bacterium]MDW8306818.1 hypothetical protein [Leptospiraceae bacterium]